MVHRLLFGDYSMPRRFRTCSLTLLSNSGRLSRYSLQHCHQPLLIITSSSLPHSILSLRAPIWTYHDTVFALIRYRALPLRFKGQEKNEEASQKSKKEERPTSISAPLSIFGSANILNTLNNTLLTPWTGDQRSEADSYRSGSSPGGWRIEIQTFPFG